MKSTLSTEARLVGKKMTELQRIALSLNATLSPDRPYSIAMVSPRDGEGRSHMAACLGIAFAQIGRRCLLVDGDLHSPTLHQWFGIPNETGVAAMLAGAEPPGDGVPIPEAPGLRVLSAGQTTQANAGAHTIFTQALWRTQALSPLLQYWAGTSDVVIIDTPQALRFVDAQVIGAQVDACVMVGREGLSYLSELTATREQLDQARANLVGCIYNEFAAPVSLASSLSLRSAPLR